MADALAPPLVTPFAAAWPSRTWTPAERATAAKMNTLRDQLNELHADGVWTDYTPTITATAGTVTVNALHTCKHMRIGKTQYVLFYFNLTLSGTPQYLRVSVPVGVSAQYSASVFCDIPGFGGMAQTLPAVNGSPDLFLFRDSSGSALWLAGGHIPAGCAMYAIQ